MESIRFSRKGPPWFLLTFLFILPITLFSLVTLSQAASPLAKGDESKQFHVDRVIDGDTVVLRGGKKVRYIGIDTPEADEPFYHKARERNLELVGGKTVTLVFCKDEPTDDYGRLLAWVYVDDKLVNIALLREGLGRALIIPPCGLEKADEVRKAEAEAKKEKLGIWGDKGKLIWGKYSKVQTIYPDEAGVYYNQYVRVYGKVRSAFKTESGLYIYYHTKGRKTFTAVILKKYFDEFATEELDPESYKGRNVTVEGVIRNGFNNYEIFLDSPDKIDVGEK